MPDKDPDIYRAARLLALAVGCVAFGLIVLALAVGWGFAAIKP